MKLVHGPKQSCKLCPATFAKLSELQNHVKGHSHKMVKCKICDKDFTEKGIRLHTERFHKPELEARKPVKKRGLRGPIKIEQEKEEKEKYPENNVYFSSSDSEIDDPDSLSDGGEKVPVKVRKTELCVQCDKYFTKKGLKIHQLKSHRSEGKRKRKRKEAKESGVKPALRKMFSCSFCHKKFSHHASMKVHEKVHMGGRPHHCDMCEAKFSNKFELYAHEREHSANRPHKCDQCNQTFKTADSLRFHKLIHQESAPCVCKFCSKRFQNKNQLQLHERVHTGEKPFACTECKESFETSGKLTRHITSSHLKLAGQPTSTV